MKTDTQGASTPKAPQTTLMQAIGQMTTQIGLALPKTITAERMARIAMTAVTNNANLGLCERNSFFGALLTAAQLGLEPNTPLGQAYLIPYKNQCQFQIGYQGLIELALRSGKYKNIQARVVYEGDTLDYVYGLEESLRHIPGGKTERPTHVYAYYNLVNGGGTFEVMTWLQIINHSQMYSQAVMSNRNSPWKSAPEEMAKKTVLKRLLKYAPKSVEIGTAVTSDEGFIRTETIKNGTDAPILNTTVEFEDAEWTDATDEGAPPKAETKSSQGNNSTTKTTAKPQENTATNQPNSREIEEALLEEQWQSQQNFDGGGLNFDN